MDLSIIIVNFRSTNLLLDCLHSIYSETSGINFEIIIVDNNSGDDSRIQIMNAYPEVKWVQMSYNAGFARANNAGIQSSSGNAVLLLNPDTIITENAIARCVDKLNSSNFIAAGVQLLNPDGSPQISGNFAMKGGLNYLLPLPYMGAFLKWLGNVFRVTKPNIANAVDMVIVDWINGAFLMVKSAAINKAGLLDEDFFLYAEEAEWCSRLSKIGPLCIFGYLHVIHLQGESANEAFKSAGKGYYNLFDRKGLQIMVSNFVRIRKEFGIGWFLTNLAAYTLEICLFPVLLLAEKLFKGGQSRYSWRHVRQFARNMIELLGLAPRIIRNRPHFYKVL